MPFTRSVPAPRAISSRNLTAASAGLALAAAVVASACGANYVRSGLPEMAPGSLPAASVSRHVLVVSIDGLRPDAIQAYQAPTLQRLMREGSYTLSASTIYPSKTLPSHTSMLTGQPPERHGVLWNNVITADTDSIDLPNIFSVARARGYSTAAFFSKPKFQPLQRAGTLDYSQAPGGLFGSWSSKRTVTDIAEYLAGSAPNLLFVHLADPDAAGHGHGWMTPEYGRAVLEADTALARLMDLAAQAFGAENYSLIVTADHGGHGTDHGSQDPRDVTIPWIAWGKGVTPGKLETKIRTMDTASTALWLLGLTPPTGWAGQSVTGAFEAGALHAVTDGTD